MIYFSLDLIFDALSELVSKRKKEVIRDSFTILIVSYFWLSLQNLLLFEFLNNIRDPNPMDGLFYFVIERSEDLMGVCN